MKIQKPKSYPNPKNKNKNKLKTHTHKKKKTNKLRNILSRRLSAGQRLHVHAYYDMT